MNWPTTIARFRATVMSSSIGRFLLLQVVWLGKVPGDEHGKDHFQILPALAQQLQDELLGGHAACAGFCVIAFTRPTTSEIASEFASFTNAFTIA